MKYYYNNNSKNQLLTLTDHLYVLSEESYLPSITVSDRMYTLTTLPNFTLTSGYVIKATYQALPESLPIQILEMSLTDNYTKAQGFSKFRELIHATFED